MSKMPEGPITIDHDSLKMLTSKLEDLREELKMDQEEFYVQLSIISTVTMDAMGVEVVAKKLDEAVQ